MGYGRNGRLAEPVLASLSSSLSTAFLMVSGLLAVSVVLALRLRGRA